MYATKKRVHLWEESVNSQPTEGSTDLEEIQPVFKVLY